VTAIRSAAVEAAVARLPRSERPVPIPSGSEPAIATDWIRPLAEPYLRGYRAVPERGADLRGYWFLLPGCRPPAFRASGQELSPHGGISLGFFVGYVIRPGACAYLRPEPPECLVFFFCHPQGSGAHGRLVVAQESLLRRTFEYIRWLTHRPPRFAFFESELATLVRHQSMRGWPRAKYQHFSRNFFIETLAWVVRSALVRKLLMEASPRATLTAAPSSQQKSKRLSLLAKAGRSAKVGDSSAGRKRR